MFAKSDSKQGQTRFSHTRPVLRLLNGILSEWCGGRDAPKLKAPGWAGTSCPTSDQNPGWEWSPATMHGSVGNQAVRLARVSVGRDPSGQKKWRRRDSGNLVPELSRKTKAENLIFDRWGSGFNCRGRRGCVPAGCSKAASMLIFNNLGSLLARVTKIPGSPFAW